MIHRILRQLQFVLRRVPLRFRLQRIQRETEVASHFLKEAMLLLAVRERGRQRGGEVAVAAFAVLQADGHATVAGLPLGPHPLAPLRLLGGEDYGPRLRVTVDDLPDRNATVAWLEVC